jgi:hypothetical protein
MDDELLNALYGVSDEQYEDDDLIKQAQAELVEAVAAESGIDLDELDDDELDKFAEYVLTGSEGGDMSDPALAEADRMGRAMAHAYADEQIKIAQLMEEGAYPGMESDPYEDVLAYHASNWDLMKTAAPEFKDLTNAEKMYLGRKKSITGAKIKDLSDSDYSRMEHARALAGRATGYYDIGSGRRALKNYRAGRAQFSEAQLKDIDKMMARKDLFKGVSRADRESLRSLLISDKEGLLMQGLIKDPLAERAQMLRLQRQTGRGLLLRGAGKAAATTGILGGVGYGLSRLGRNSR